MIKDAQALLDVVNTPVRLPRAEHAALKELAGPGGIQDFLRELIQHAIRMSTENRIEDVRCARQNLKWHALLEEVLNDPDESADIEKNLEWAMLAVSEKRKVQGKGSGK